MSQVFIVASRIFVLVTVVSVAAGVYWLATPATEPPPSTETAPTIAPIVDTSVIAAPIIGVVAVKPATDTLTPKKHHKYVATVVPAK